MPIYEYRCDKCGKIVEVLAKSSGEEPLSSCPICGKEQTFTKVFSTFAAHGAADHTPAFSGPKNGGGGCGGPGCACGLN